MSIIGQVSADAGPSQADEAIAGPLLMPQSGACIFNPVVVALHPGATGSRR
jgi:hypothetical protein